MQEYKSEKEEVNRTLAEERLYFQTAPFESFKKGKRSPFLAFLASQSAFFAKWFIIMQL